MLIVVVFLLFLTGIALLFLGKRGRKIDDHPICAKCGFDLFGRPSDSPRCSECGGLVNASGGFRSGNRQSKPVLIFTGYTLALPSLLLAIFVFYAAATGFNYLPYTPTWLVIQNATRGSDSQKSAAFAELATRLSSRAHVDAIAGTALALQRNPAVDWDYRWGGLLEDAQAFGTLSPRDWDQFLANLIVTRANVRTRLAMDEGLLVVNFPESRCGGTHALPYAPRFRVESELVITSGTTKFSIPSGNFEPYCAASYGYDQKRFPTSLNEQLGPGPHHVTLQHIFKVTSLRSSAPAVIGKTARELDLLILPPGTLSTKLLRGPELDVAVRSCTKVSHFGYQPAGGHYYVQVDVAPPPANLAFEVYVRSTTGLVNLGNVYFYKGRQAGHTRGSTTQPNLIFTDPPEFLLRSTPQAAAETTDMFEIYAGEFTPSTDGLVFQAK